MDDITKALGLRADVACKPEVRAAPVEKVAVEGAKARIGLLRQIRDRAAGRGAGRSQRPGPGRAQPVGVRPRARAVSAADAMLMAAEGAEARLAELLDTLAQKERAAVRAGAPCPRCAGHCHACGAGL